MKERIMTKSERNLFISLVCWSLVPSVYMLLRMNIIKITGADIDILGQMEWFDLIDEILVTMLTVPVYSILKKMKNKGNMALFFSVSEIYILFSIGIAFSISHITRFMQAENASQYLLAETFSMMAGFILSLGIIYLTVFEQYQAVSILTVFRFVLFALFDFILIPKLQEAGAAYSEIITNGALAIVVLFLLRERKILSGMSWDWVKDFFRIGSFAGIQIFLDNFIYAVMICKMVNAVSESGNYWVANNFIWGWLLVPVLCYTEIIKKNNTDRLPMKKTAIVGLCIAGVWLISMPFWKWFISGPMASNASEILPILYILVPFYLSYIASSFIDGWFISKGYTGYNALNSVIVNLGYYGIMYALFRKGFFTTNMSFIICLFGFGMIVHLIVSVFCYTYAQRRH